MRGRVAARPVLPLVTLALALFVFSALGSLVTCHDAGADAVDRVAVSETLPAASCPGCLPATSSDPTSAETDVQSAADACTSDRPCHGPASANAKSDTTMRASSPGETAALAALPVCTVPHRVDPPSVAVSVTGPVPPAAVRAPVPVLCVDRN